MRMKEIITNLRIKSLTVKQILLVSTRGNHREQSGEYNYRWLGGIGLSGLVCLTILYKVENCANR